MFFIRVGRLKDKLYVLVGRELASSRDILYIRMYSHSYSVGQKVLYLI